MVSDVSYSQAGDGKVKIGFSVDERLLGTSAILINNAEYPLNSEQISENEWEYELNYRLPALGVTAISYMIRAIDLANNLTEIVKTNQAIPDVSAPTAKIELSDPSPTKAGEVKITVTTTEELVAEGLSGGEARTFASPLLTLIFIDAEGEEYEITLSGSSNTFTGIWTVGKQAEGEGFFSFKNADELRDSFGNSGSAITEGGTVKIDYTAPKVSDITPEPAGSGIVKLNFDTDEELSNASVIVVSNREFPFTSTGRENIKGGWSYRFNYKIPSAGIESISITIRAVDLANNEEEYHVLLTEEDLQVFAPTAKIGLSDPSPTKAGAVLVKITTSKPVATNALNLVFTDAEGTGHPIVVRSTVAAGSVPPATNSWTYFEGIWLVDEDVAEGDGTFSFRDADELKDSEGNSGSSITEGDTVEIDYTPPASDVTVMPSGEGRVKISFTTGEQLMASSTIEIAGKKYNFTREVDNGDGTWTYSYEYAVSRGEGNTPYRVCAIDLAGNSRDFDRELPELDKLDVFAPTAIIELLDPSPVGRGDVTIDLITSEQLDENITSLTLIFTDESGKEHDIILNGSGTNFTGTWKIDEEAEGKGIFTLKTAMIDKAKNQGYAIAKGIGVEIDITPPKIKDIKAVPNPAKAGPVVIGFNASEQLSGDSTITVNGELDFFTVGGVPNKDDTYTYTYTYGIRPDEGVKEADVLIDAVDAAGNLTRARSKFQIDAESPAASIELTDSSPTFTGIVGVKVTTSEPVVALPTPLVFTDNESISFEIKLKGKVPGTIFTGILVVNKNVAEGVGRFSFRDKGALEDMAGNRGVTITSGALTIIAQVEDLGGWAYPNPFTPTGDGDKTKIKVVNVPKDAEVEIRIYDITGRQVKKLTNMSEWEWDGKNENGKFVEGGLYIFQIRAGREHASGTVVVIR